MWVVVDTFENAQLIEDQDGQRAPYLSPGSTSLRLACLSPPGGRHDRVSRV